ncbi:LysR family transcriptional regulator [Pseudaestuariivita atlantica]|uniref:HTH lysR-type domain-containing protein n=1 Tax=Pseudaestuariivita atlantica TaxID=1317121 RepID=A0A0L1JP15_9RHOB|nr:LysR family transcriptional regulator [Pseudaestuariivita atlantica]KNG93163.1 hypothetical protein ATO11_14350 [Pseudaestuariivita atlantica]
MNLRFLRTVVAVSKHGSLNAAAQSLGLSHSAVSLQIKALEEELQFAILDRSRRPPVMTGAGLALVDHARRIEDVASDIRALAKGHRLSGRATLGAAPSTVQSLMAPSLARLVADHPALEIEMLSASSASLLDRVRDGAVHAALVTAPRDPDPALSLAPICDEPYQMIVSTRAGALPFDRLLATRPFIWFDRRTRLSFEIEAYLLRHGWAARSTMEVDSFEGVEALVRNDLGISILPRRALAPALEGIRVIPLPNERLTRPIVLASRRNSPRAGLIQSLEQILRDLVAGA